MMQATASPTVSSLPLVSWRGALLALLMAFLLAWPMLIVSAPLLFFDTAPYWNHGKLAVDGLSKIVSYFLSGTDGSTDASRLLSTSASEAKSVRSIPYSIFVYIASLSPLGLAGTAIVQGASVLFVCGALVERELTKEKVRLGVLLLVLSTLTPLPWFTAYMMPDILGASVVAYAIFLVWRFDDSSFWQRATLCCLVTFAIVAHYGNIPFAIACLGAALAVLTFTRRLNRAVIVASVTPVLLAVSANALVGALAFHQPSATPLRLPLLLARSMEDGPARWYLQEKCPTEHYVVCDYFGGKFPDNISDIMWNPGGLRYADPQTMSQIRDEETVILRRAFFEYPLQQIRPFAKNIAIQLISVGARTFSEAERWIGGDGLMQVAMHNHERRSLFKAFSLVQSLALVAALGLIAVLGFRSGFLPRERDVLIVVAVAYLANATIYGGLSAPVDRYQARIAWIVPFVAGLFWLARQRRNVASRIIAPTGRDAPPASRS